MIKIIQYTIKNINNGNYMERNKLFEHIILNPKVMAGKPIIKGTRLTVQYILNLLAHGSTIDEILSEYKELSRDDIQACFLYASETIDQSTILPLVKSI